VGNKITVGWATWLGTIGAAAGVLIPLVGDLADAAAPLGVSGSVWVIAGAILGVAVVLGRMAQAVALSVSPPPVGADLLPDVLPEEQTDIGLTD
jgi:hypothetical protein